jgi:hypothetical protein
MVGSYELQESAPKFVIDLLENAPKIDQNYLNLNFKIEMTKKTLPQQLLTVLLDGYYSNFLTKTQL